VGTPLLHIDDRIGSMPVGATPALLHYVQRFPRLVDLAGARLPYSLGE
jgi:hypothetical protein